MEHIKQRIKNLATAVKFRLSTMDKLIPVSLLSILIGLVTGLVIVAFRWVIEESQVLILNNNDPESYESLPGWLQFALPTLGGLIIGLIFQRIKESERAIGVVHVMRNLAHNQGRLPFKNAALQFIGAAISIISGHSVGREGPCIHLGAASGSLLGQAFLVPNNILRTLVGCGVAAAIAASFNTPLAGVIFAMEVILMEYALVSFIPIIISAVVATAVMQAVYGDAPVLVFPSFNMGSLDHLGNVFLMGLMLGILAALFIQSLRFFSRQLTNQPLWQRTTIAGALTGLIAIFIPEIMSLGYDTVNGAALGEFAFWALILITLAKVLATTLGLGLGLPGGLIGPTVFIGATFGAAFGALWADADTSLGFYALIGMAAMMSATLNAPLAALTAILELTANPNIIMPGMLAIVVANLTTTQLFGQDSVYHMQLKDKGITFDNNPVSQYLRGLSINHLLKKPVFFLPHHLLSIKELSLHLQHSGWLLIKSAETPHATLINIDDVKNHLNNIDAQPDAQIDLLSLPVDQSPAAAINLRASLQDALASIRNEKVDTLYVVDNPLADTPIIYGIITRSDIEKTFLDQMKNSGS